MITKQLMLLSAALALPVCAAAQETFTLQQCRDSAIANNNNLKAARQKVAMAGYDRKIAMSNYFPDISATATYQFNSRNLDLLPENVSDALSGAGSSAQGAFDGMIGRIMSDPLLSTIIKTSPELQQLFAKISSMDVAAPLNAINSEIQSAFELNIQNMFAGAVSLKQPVFMGGKIVAGNRMAKLAEDLAQSQYDTEYRTVVSEVDQTYWQIISIANKKRLAQDYADLLHQLKHDAEIMEKEGVATKADVLTINVKANEADMMLTKATNGLVLSRMLLCKLCGMDLYKDIRLADEDLDMIPLPRMGPVKSDEEIFNDRPEIRSLDLASRIYDKKITMARADMMPKVALTANYFLTNPNLFHGFQNEFAGFFNVGVAVNIPIIHGCQSMNKVRKAKAEAVLTRYRLEDAKEMVTLQVAQLRKQEEETLEKLNMAESNLDSAEENLRTATIGFSEGVIPANTVLEAQTAWMKAHSEYIDAGVELQLCAVSLASAEGR